MPGNGYACGTGRKEGMMTTDQGPYPAQYPVQFAVEYPDRPLNRLTSFFRIFVIIPIWIVLGTVSGATWEWAGGHSSMGYGGAGDRKSTRLNSSHSSISYAVFCLKKKKQTMSSTDQLQKRTIYNKKLLECANR